MTGFTTGVPAPGAAQRHSTAPPVPGAPRLSALDRHFQLSLFLLLLVSVLTLVSTGKLDLLSALLPPVALLVKGYGWWRGREPELSSRTATWLVIGYFAFFPLDLLYVSRLLAAGAQNPLLFAALLAAIHLMLFAMIVRLYSAVTTRDYLFLAVLAFAAMLASAILTVDTAFLVFFFLFMMVAVSTFVGLEMRRGAEGATSPTIESGTAPARRLHTALGVTSGAIALGALIAGAGIFFMLPRFSAGYFSRFDLQPSLISGFSDDVELGQIGEIKRSNAVVMRIQVEGGLAAARGVHWRGIALTTFDGRRWTTEAHDPIATRESADGWTYLRGDPLNNPGLNDARLRRASLPNRAGLREASLSGNSGIGGDFAVGKNSSAGNSSRDNSSFGDSLVIPRQYAVPLHYTVLLEPIASDALFVAAEPVKIRGQFAGDTPPAGRVGRRTYLVVDKTGSLSNPFHNFVDVRYDAVSELPQVPAAMLRAAPATYDQATRDLYLQLPQLDPRIPALARQIVAGASNPYDQAHAVEQYLQTHYGYTLDLVGPPPADPLVHFLFETRAGHCEYFAAAMTVMLRTLGVPARYVNGFLPGEYNDVGGDFIIRARDAHSWVEAFFPGYGWITFDPTPESEERAAGLLAHAALYWDWFEMQWSEWIINYDFFHQYTLAQNLQRASRSWTTDASRSFDRARNQGIAWVRDWQQRLTSLPTWVYAWLLVPFALLGALGLCLNSASLRERLILAWRLRGLGVRASLPPQAASFSYRRMLRILEQRGWRKLPAQTPLEFAASLPTSEVRAPVLVLTDMYLAARFGSRAADGKRFADQLGVLQAALRAGAAAR